MTDKNSASAQDATKFSGRRENRVAAMQFLYMVDVNPPDDLVDAMRVFFSSLERPREFYSFAEELVAGAMTNLDAIDSTIAGSVRNWEFHRIAKVDLAILRLAVYELKWRHDIPPVVSINEAIELAKSFSDAEAKRFINGVLDRIKGGLDRPLRKPSV